MYLDHFKLVEMPFKITPDPRYLYHTPQHKEALARCQYVVAAHEGLAVIYGDVGMGKTTLTRRLYELIQEDDKCKVAMLPTPSLKTETAFLTAIMDELKIPPKRSYKASLDAFKDKLIESYREGFNTVIIIDEAQKLTARMLDVVHTLLNIETNQDKLIQMILVGQRELIDTIDRARHIKSRVKAFGELPPLSQDDTNEMIAFRWHIAGNGKTSHPFTEKALEAIYLASGGLPREINKLCDYALLSAFQYDQTSINADHIIDAAKELRLAVQTGGVNNG